MVPVLQLTSHPLRKACINHDIRGEAWKVGVPVAPYPSDAVGGGRTRREKEVWVEVSSLRVQRRHVPGVVANVGLAVWTRHLGKSLDGAV